MALLKKDYRAACNKASEQQPVSITAEEIVQSVRKGVEEMKNMVPTFGGSPDSCFDKAFGILGNAAFSNFYPENFDTTQLIITKEGGPKVKTQEDAKSNLLHTISIHAGLVYMAKKCVNLDNIDNAKAYNDCASAIPNTGIVRALRAFGAQQGNGLSLMDAYVHAIHQIEPDKKCAMKSAPK